MPRVLEGNDGGLRDRSRVSAERVQRGARLRAPARADARRLALHASHRGRGRCSGPLRGLGRTMEFVTACQAHDYGYDLVRFGVGVRSKADELFYRDMKATCFRRGPVDGGACRCLAHLDERGSADRRRRRVRARTATRGGLEASRTAARASGRRLLGEPVESLLDRVAHQLVALAEVELGQDVLDVVLHRLLADEQFLRDLAVRVSLGDEEQHLVLAG